MQYKPADILWETSNGEISNYWTIYARQDEEDAEDGRWQIAYVDEKATDAVWITQTNYDILSLLFHDENNDYM